VGYSWFVSGVIYIPPIDFPKRARQREREREREREGGIDRGEFNATEELGMSFCFTLNGIRCCT